LQEKKNGLASSASEGERKAIRSKRRNLEGVRKVGLLTRAGGKEKSIS